MKFKNALSELPYPKKFKTILQRYHSDIVDYALEFNDGTKSFHRKLVDMMNCITYHVMSGDSLPDTIVNGAELAEIDPVDDDACEDVIGAMFIHTDSVDWSGIEIISIQDPQPEQKSEPIQKRNISVISHNLNPPTTNDPPTPATHLYLVAPKVPRFDLSKDPWFRSASGGVIYKSLPIIPKRQVDITITTDPDGLTDMELMSLYPNRTVHTRAEVMYQEIPGVHFDSELGILFPIKGFTERQIRDNIIRYPHIFRLKREVDGVLESFYHRIEIDGELYPVEEIIDTLPEFKKIPKDQEFIKEYVVRRYLLERDVKHIEHKYPLYGTLDPFLTLFMTPSTYSKYGITDYVETARACVKCRVSYLQSRNPYIRSMYQPGTCIFAHRCQEHKCDGSCPIYGETSYLLERNAIPFSPAVFGASDTQLETAFSLIRSDDRFVVYESAKTIEASYILTYCAICENWRGNAFHCVVYRLDYSKYLDDLKKSWSMKDTPDSLEYQSIWMNGAKVLIVTNLDYINFKDFEAQTLLNLIHTRASNGLKTIIVSPKVANLIGTGAFYKRMQDNFREAVTAR